MTLYLQIQLIVSSIIFFMGLSLIIDYIPHKLRHSMYDRARKYLGVGYIIMGLATFVYCFTDIRYRPMYYATALNLTAYYGILIMYKLSFMTLLGGKDDNEDTTAVSYIVSCVVFPIPMWCAIWYGNLLAIKYVLILSDIIFFFLMLYHIRQFFNEYHKAIGRANNVYSEDIEAKIGWVNKSIYLVIAKGFVGVIAAFFSIDYMIIGYIFMFFALGIYIYVYKRFCKFIIDFSTITFESNNVVHFEEQETPETIEMTIIPEEEEVIAEEETLENKTQINNETYLIIQKNLNKWINGDNYSKNGITIYSVAADIYTNRTYLSNYINATYKCSFKVWVTRLRIEKAKTMMLSDKEMSVNDIAKAVGCSSATSFNHLFKQSESISPAKWRDRQIRNMQN